MHNQLNDLKFFIVHHCKNGVSKKTLLSFLMHLEDEKKAIVRDHYKRDITKLQPILIKQYLMKYLDEITKHLGKNVKSKGKEKNRE